MKLNENAFNFAQKLLKLHSKESSLSSKIPESLSKNISNKNEDNTINNLKLDPKRIVGGTDYKKYENLAKQQDLDEVKNLERTNDALKMGCNNDFRKERQLLDKPSKDKLDACKTFKNEGDDLIKEKKFKEAVMSYEKALLQLFYTFSDNPEEDKEVDRLKSAINMNVSMCKINLGLFEEAINCCNEALRVDNKNMKAIYRIAFSYFKLDKLDEAKKSIQECLELDSKEKLFNDLKDQIEFKEKENDLKAKKMFKKFLK
jgi:FK506-binding protein 4/5